jgi:acetyl esterase/lipase
MPQPASISSGCPQRFAFRVSAALAVAVSLTTLRVASVAADEPSIDYETDIVYGQAAGEDLKLDLATPKGLDHPVPAIVVIHGGGWQGGNRQGMASIAKQAAAHGYVAATISYRLAPKHIFPAQVEDCKCAVRWLRSVAEERHIDPDKIGAVGMSAGAHLAMMLGTMDSGDGLEGTGGNADRSSKVQAVVSFVGPVNLVGDFPLPSVKILEVLVGGPLPDKQDLLKQASPITYVTSGDAPMLLFFGTRDPLVPYDQAFQMTRALTNSGIPSRVELLVGAGHGWAGKDMDRTLEETWQYFDRNLKTEPDAAATQVKESADR